MKLFKLLIYNVTKIFLNLVTYFFYKSEYKRKYFIYFLQTSSKCYFFLNTVTFFK